MSWSCLIARVSFSLRLGHEVAPDTLVRVTERHLLKNTGYPVTSNMLFDRVQSRHLTLPLAVLSYWNTKNFATCLIAQSKMGPLLQVF